MLANARGLLVGFVAALQLGATGVAGTPPSAVVCRQVVDGDTMIVEAADGSVTTVHLWGVDAPESSAPYGSAAARRLAALALDRAVTLDVRGALGGEALARVSVDGRDLGEVLLEEGLAELPIAGDTDDGYAALVFIARSSGVGLWSGDPAPAPETIDDQTVFMIVPTPTPSPRTGHRLSQIAGQVRIAEEGDDAEIAGLVPEEVRRKETWRFSSRISGLSSEMYSLQRLKSRLEKECRVDVARIDGSGGTYWSPELNRWVTSGDRRASDCVAMKDRYIALRDEVRRERDTAVGEARRFGVRESDIKKLLKERGLDGI